MGFGNIAAVAAATVVAVVRETTEVTLVQGPGNQPLSKDRETNLVQGPGNQPLSKDRETNYLLGLENCSRNLLRVRRKQF